MNFLLSMLVMCAATLSAGHKLSVCIMIGTPEEMLTRILGNWLRSWPAGTTEIDGIRLTSHLHYVDLTGDANGDLRIDLQDFLCVSQNWRN